MPNAKTLFRPLLAVITVASIIVWGAPAFAQEEGGTGGGTPPAGETTGGGTAGGTTGGTTAGAAGGDAGVKEEGGVKATKLTTGEYEFEETVIEGRLEKPVALFIKRQQPEFKTVRFARDFWDDVLRPIDKEEFEKAIKESKFDYVKNPLLWMAITTTAAAGAAAGYQAYNKEWGQVEVYGIAAGVGAVSSLVIVLIERGHNRAAK